MTVESPPATANRTGTARNRAIIARLTAKLKAGLKSEVMAECEALEAEGGDHPAALYVLAVLAYEHGVIKAAFDAVAKAHECDPNEPVFAEMLAVLYTQAGNTREALYYAKLSQSLGLDAATLALLPRSLPGFAQAMATIRETPHLIQAEARAGAGRYADAVALYETHLAFFPNDPAGTRGIVRSLLALNQPVRALAYLSDFAETGVRTAEDIGLLGEAYAALGNAAAAADSHREAAALAPASPDLACARLRDAVYDPGLDAAGLAGLAATTAALLLPPPAARPPAAPAGERALRVGFLISALRDPRDLETVATVLADVDPRRTRRTVYGYGSIDDSRNVGLHYCYDRWNDIAGCDPHTIAAIVEGDEIDVLVDAGGAASAAQLAGLALRPAPYLVSWLGNPGTLGLGVLDAELVDAFEIGDSDPGATAGVPRLAVAAGLYGYEPARPAVRTAAGASGAFVFGADIHLPQLHDDLLAAWATLLTAMPEARLALRDREFVDGNLLSWLVTRFKSVGIAERIDIVAADSAAFSAQIDVLLAPFVELNPHDTAAALRQGTPVVALAGAGRHRRQSATLLHRCGLNQLVAGDVDGYVGIAAGLAGSADAWRAAAEAAARAAQDAPPFRPAEVAAGLQTALRAVAGLPA